MRKQPSGNFSYVQAPTTILKKIMILVTLLLSLSTGQEWPTDVLGCSDPTTNPDYVVCRRSCQEIYRKGQAPDV